LSFLVYVEILEADFDIFSILSVVRICPILEEVWFRLIMARGDVEFLASICTRAFDLETWLFVFDLIIIFIDLELELAV